MAEMKSYKILFDVLVTCYIEIMRIIKDISAQNMTDKQLKFNTRYHLLLNLSYYFYKFSKPPQDGEVKDQKDKHQNE